MNFRPTGVYVISSFSKTLNNFSTGFFPMYREILELKTMLVFCAKIARSQIRRVAA